MRSSDGASGYQASERLGLGGFMGAAGGLTATAGSMAEAREEGGLEGMEVTVGPCWAIGVGEAKGSKGGGGGAGG